MIAGLLALNSALNTLALRDVVIGAQSISTLSGIGLGVYLTLAGSIIALLAGLAPHPIGGDVARAEIRLWQPSFAIFGSIFVLFVLGAIGLGVWLGGGGSNANVTPTPASFNSGLLATPLINAQVNPLVSPEATESGAGEPTATATENLPAADCGTAADSDAHYRVDRGPVAHADAHAGAAGRADFHAYAHADRFADAQPITYAVALAAGYADRYADRNSHGDADDHGDNHADRHVDALARSFIEVR